MKKLISLLSVLTISGTTMPSAIAANKYEKEEYKLQNITNIKKLNTNNLENLNKRKYYKNEIIAYYNWKEKDEIVTISPVLQNYWKTKVFTLNLGTINPLDYKYIEFLGNTNSNCWGTRVEWGSWVYNNTKDKKCDTTKQKGTDISTYMKNRKNEFDDIIENVNAKQHGLSPSYEQSLQRFWDKDGEARIETNQRFGLSFYWKDGNYFLQVITLQYLEWWASEASLTGYIKIGSGIRLYNDNKTKSSLTLENNPKLDINSMAKLTDTVSASGKSILKFKIPSELNTNLLTAKYGATQMTQEKKDNINEKISRYIKSIIREKIHEKILEINNSLTENDYDITFKYPNNTTHFNPLNTRIVMDFIITGKNNAIGKVEQELIIDTKN